MPICPTCRKFIKDVGKHLRRGKCKGRKKSKTVSLPMPGSPEERLERIGRFGG